MKQTREQKAQKAAAWYQADRERILAQQKAYRQARRRELLANRAIVAHLREALAAEQ